MPLLLICRIHILYTTPKKEEGLFHFIWCFLSLTVCFMRCVFFCYHGCCGPWCALSSLPPGPLLLLHSPPSLHTARHECGTRTPTPAWHRRARPPGPAGTPTGSAPDGTCRGRGPSPRPRSRSGGAGSTAAPQPAWLRALGRPPLSWASTTWDHHHHSWVTGGCGSCWETMALESRLHSGVTKNPRIVIIVSLCEGDCQVQQFHSAQVCVRRNMRKLQRLGAPHESEKCATQLLQTPQWHAGKINLMQAESRKLLTVRLWTACLCYCCCCAIKSQKRSAAKTRQCDTTQIKNKKQTWQPWLTKFWGMKKILRLDISPGGGETDSV